MNKTASFQNRVDIFIKAHFSFAAIIILASAAIIAPFLNWIVSKLLTVSGFLKLVHLSQTPIGIAVLLLMSLILGLLLFTFKTIKGNIYGVIEVFIGAIGATIVIQHFPVSSSTKTLSDIIAYCISLFASIYIIVRGLDCYMRWHRRESQMLADSLKSISSFETVIGQLKRTNIINNIIVQRRLCDWEYGGTWQPLENGIIDVTNSPDGGLYKYGYSWKNYSFSFDFLIQHMIMGWILRANKSGGKIMLNLSNVNLRFHFKKSQADQYQHLDYQIQLPMYDNQWHHMESKVEGSIVTVFIDGLNIKCFDIPDYLNVGTVGLRCHGNEHSQYRNLKVVSELL